MIDHMKQLYQTHACAETCDAGLRSTLCAASDAPSCVRLVFAHANALIRPDHDALTPLTLEAVRKLADDPVPLVGHLAVTLLEAWDALVELASCKTWDEHERWVLDNQWYEPLARKGEAQ